MNFIYLFTWKNIPVDLQVIDLCSVQLILMHIISEKLIYCARYKFLELA